MSVFISALLFDVTKSAVAAALGFLFARFVLTKIESHRFGGWRIKVVTAEGEVATDRELSVTKAKVVLDDDADLSVFVKGVASTYGWLNVDPMTKGREIGLLVIDHRKRSIVIDLGKNPPKAGGPKS